MSELSVSSIQSKSVGVTPMFKDGIGTEIGRLCLASVNFNGTGTVAIRSSFNVLGITDNGVGNYTLNFENSLPSPNFVPVFGAQRNGTNSGAFIAIQFQSTPSVNSLQVQGLDTGTNAIDPLIVSVAIFL